MHPNDLETTRWCLFFNRLILGHRKCNNHGHFFILAKCILCLNPFSCLTICVGNQAC